MTREQKLLNAAKFALASLKLNNVKLPASAQLLERAILEYGIEHVDE